MKCKTCECRLRDFNEDPNTPYCAIGVSEEEAYSGGGGCRFNKVTVKKRLREAAELKEEARNEINDIGM